MMEESLKKIAKEITDRENVRQKWIQQMKRNSKEVIKIMKEIKECNQCFSENEKKRVVFPRGILPAKIMIVGLGPAPKKKGLEDGVAFAEYNSWYEKRFREPVLEELGIKNLWEENVWVSNLIKCASKETGMLGYENMCYKFLEQEIERNIKLKENIDEETHILCFHTKTYNFLKKYLSHKYSSIRIHKFYHPQSRNPKKHDNENRDKARSLRKILN